MHDGVSRNMALCTRTGVTRGGRAENANAAVTAEPKYSGSRETGIKRRKQKYLQVRCAPSKKNLN